MNLKGIKDSANFTLKRKEAGGVKKTVLYAPYATETTISLSSDQVYVMKKNVRAIRFDTAKEGTLTATAELIDLTFLPVLLGGDWEDGIRDVITREVLTVTGGKVTLPSAPLTGTLEIFQLEDDLNSHKVEIKVGDPLTKENEYSITGLEVSLNATSQPDGTNLVVYYIPETYVGTGKHFVVESQKEPANYEIYGDTMVRDENGIDSFFHFFAPNAKPQSALELTLSADGVANISMTFDLLEGVFSDKKRGLLEFISVD